MKIAVFGMIRG